MMNWRTVLPVRCILDLMCNSLMDCTLTCFYFPNDQQSLKGLGHKMIFLLKAYKIIIFFASLKILTTVILKIVSETVPKFLYRLPLCHRSIFFSVLPSLDAEKIRVIVHIPGGFRHDFMKGFSQLVSDFIEAGRKFL